MHFNAQHSSFYVSPKGFTVCMTLTWVSKKQRILIELCAHLSLCGSERIGFIRWVFKKKKRRLDVWKLVLILIETLWIQNSPGAVMNTHPLAWVYTHMRICLSSPVYTVCCVLQLACFHPLRYPSVSMYIFYPKSSEFEMSAPDLNVYSLYDIFCSGDNSIWHLQDTLQTLLVISGIIKEMVWHLGKYIYFFIYLINTLYLIVRSVQKLKSKNGT